MKTRLIAPLLVLLATCLQAQPAWAVISAAEAMNLSGMQRMLSQRIAKSYLMLGAEVRPEQAGQQLDQSIASSRATTWPSVNTHPRQRSAPPWSKPAPPGSNTANRY